MPKDERELFQQQLWKEQEQEKMSITMEEVCARARRRERFSVAGYWTVLSLTALFALGFVRNLIQFRDPWLITGTVWALAALCLVSWRLLRKGPARMDPAEPCVQFLRRELESKRQGFLCIRWLAVLLFPAILVLWWDSGPMLRAKTLGVQAPSILQLLRGPIPLVIAGLIIAFIWFTFSRQAQKVQRELTHLRTDQQI